MKNKIKVLFEKKTIVFIEDTTAACGAMIQIK